MKREIFSHKVHLSYINLERKIGNTFRDVNLTNEVKSITLIKIQTQIEKVEL